LARELGIPPKYVVRAAAVLRRYRLAHFDGQQGFSLVATWPLPLNTKTGVGRKVPRRAITSAQKRRLWVLDGRRCSSTGLHLDFADSAVDHIVPLALGGADALGNWAIVHRDENAQKWDRFPPRLKWYRGRRVRGGIGMVWDKANQCFWPRINGRVEKATRLPG
jgi:HNH endonuclease